MNCYTDEQWIDYMMGGSSDEQSSDMYMHKETCSQCRSKYSEWNKLLRNSPVQSEGVYNEGYIENQEYLYPSKRVKQSLRRHMRQLYIAKMLPRGRKLAFAAAAACICAILLSGLFKMAIPEQAVNAPLQGYVEKHEPQAVTVLQDPQTSVYRIVNDSLNDGYIWISHDSREAFIFLESPPLYDYIDYRVWTVRDNHPINMGLFQIHDGSAHLYVREMHMQGSNIMVSSEPKEKGNQTAGADTVLFVVP